MFIWVKISIKFFSFLNDYMTCITNNSLLRCPSITSGRIVRFYMFLSYWRMRNCCWFVFYPSVNTHSWYFLHFTCRFGSRIDEPNGESEKETWKLSRRDLVHSLMGSCSPPSMMDSTLDIPTRTGPLKSLRLWALRPFLGALTWTAQWTLTCHLWCPLSL